MGKRYSLRCEIVSLAKKQGNKAAARFFKTTVKTVRKWVNRYKEQGYTGLKELSRAPHKQWKKCEPEFETKVIKLRKKTKNKFGAGTLQERFGLERSVTCINRIIQENPELRRKRKTKTDKRNELWATKKLMKAFECVQIDVKELMDIANYYVQQWRHPDMPKYEITARCVKTGATFVCLADTKEAINIASFTAMLLQHLKNHGFDVKKIAVQTDNGTEFHNLKLESEPSLFEKVANHFQVKQNRIPPASPTFNSDVETFHRLGEDEFYAIERFKDAEDLYQQLYTYMIDFNYLRTNSYKDKKTPVQLLKEDYPKINENILNFPIVKIDNYHNFYFDLFPDKQEKQIANYDPEEFFLFHDIDPNDLPGGYHVSNIHIIF